VAISKRLRFEILTRDSHRCAYCGAAAPDVKLAVDHVLPEALGGRTEADNLVTACVDCNAGKSSVTASREKVAAVAEDALRWSRAIRLAAERRSSANAEIDSTIKTFDEAWSGWNYDAHETVVVKKAIPRDPDWRESIERLLALGLPASDLDRLMRVAMANKTLTVGNIWRYFMGCCWNTLKQIQEEAAALMRTDEAPAVRLCSECGDAPALDGDELCVGCERALRGPNAPARELEPEGRAPRLAELAEI
jgi:hypothetical protein